jgi:peptide/nickel transport system ATP-binding protein
MKPLLQVENLNLFFSLFEGRSHVLKDLSFHIEPGERVAIVGESGCGKSVTLRTLLGLLQGDHTEIIGRLRFDDMDLLKLSPRQWQRLRGKRISMIFQDPMAALNPTFTVGDQLLSVAKHGGKIGGKGKALTRIHEALRRVSINDPDVVLQSYPFQLSGGLNQRILITMALLNSPELVLADEPGTALDVTVQEQTLRLMRNLTDELGSAVLLITHNLGVVREFAERVYVMYAGMIVEEGATAQVFAGPKHPYTRALLASVPKLTGGDLPQGIDGLVPDYTVPPPGCRFHPRCSYAREACKQSQPLRNLGGGHRVACLLYDTDSRHG